MFSRPRSVSLVPNPLIVRQVIASRSVCTGVCHSDIHTVRGEWGPQAYPMTVGHEMVGTVAEIGAEVTKHEVGDKVGVGTMVNACRRCEYCLNGQEQYCADGNIQAYAGVDRDGTITQGGYSTHAVVVEDFVLKIPDAIPFEAAELVRAPAGWAGDAV